MLTIKCSFVYVNIGVEFQPFVEQTLRQRAHAAPDVYVERQCGPWTGVCTFAHDTSRLLMSESVKSVAAVLFCVQA
jgi:hypothetical protein